MSVLTKRDQLALKGHSKTFMRFAIALLLYVLTLTPLQAGWSLSALEPLPCPAGLEFNRRTVSNGGESAELRIVSFSPKTHTFTVMDNPDGVFDAGSAAQKRGALAAVNGGYFQPDRTPLGLVVRQGVEIHPLQKAKLLSGVLAVAGERIALQRTAGFKTTSGIREALQAGPFLIDGARPVAGLNQTRSAARTVVFMESSGRCGFLTCRSATLAAMAEILSTPLLVPEGKITRALNLDGGSSSALWVRSQPVFYDREWKTVRNYLAIVPRD